MSQTQRQRAEGKQINDCKVGLRMSDIKPLVPAFLQNGMSRLIPEVVRGAWRKSELHNCFDPLVQLAALNQKQKGTSWGRQPAAWYLI